MGQHRPQKENGNPTASHQVPGFQGEARTCFLVAVSSSFGRLGSNFQEMGLTGYCRFPMITLKTDFSGPFHLQNWRPTPSAESAGGRGWGRGRAGDLDQCPLRGLLTIKRHVIPKQPGMASRQNHLWVSQEFFFLQQSMAVFK